MLNLTNNIKKIKLMTLLLLLSVLGYLGVKAADAPPPDFVVYQPSGYAVAFNTAAEAGDYFVANYFKNSIGPTKCIRFVYPLTSVQNPSLVAGADYQDAKKGSSGEIIKNCTDFNIWYGNYAQTGVATAVNCYNSSLESNQLCWAAANKARVSQKAAGPQDCDICEGNPIYVSSGNKFQRDVDFDAPYESHLSLVRYYNSLPSSYGYKGDLGTAWRHSFEYYLIPQNVGYKLIRPTGNAFVVGGSDPDVVGDVSVVYDTAGNLTGYVYDDLTEQIEEYNKGGYLTKITYRSGGFISLTYTTGFRLAQVVNQDGKALVFNRSGPTSAISSVSLPTGINLVYTLTSGVALTKVTGTGIYYQYGYSSTNGLQLLLESVNSDGSVYAKWTYDGLGRGLTSQHGQAGNEKVIISYTAGTGSTSSTASVQKGIGASSVSTHSSSFIHGSPKVTSTSNACASGVCTETRAYDSTGLLVESVDAEGSKTCLAYDLGRRLVNLKVEGLDSSVSCSAALSNLGSLQGVRVTSIQWDSMLRLPVAISEPGLITTYTRDSMGRILTETQQSTLDATGAAGLGASELDSVSSQTSYTYDAIGRLLSVTKDGSAVVNTYVAGMLTQVSYPDGTLVSLSGHNALGQPTSVTGQAGEPLTLTYSSLGQLLSIAGDQETITHVYSSHNLLTSSSSSLGYSMAYTYDPSRRLTTVTDELGRTVNNTLDANSMLTQVQIKESGVTTHQVNRVFDALGRMTQYTGP